MSRDILIVDDSTTIRAMIKRATEMIGLDIHEVYEAGNGMEALAQMADHSMAIVLVDISMPVMNGMQLVRAMQKHETLRDIPVVVISTEGSEQRREGLEALGIAGFIRKPFSPEQLREVLEPILGNTNEQDDLAATTKDVF